MWGLGVGAGGPVLSRGLLAGRGVSRTGSPKAPRSLRWARAALHGPSIMSPGHAQQVAHATRKVSAVCWGGHWSGLMLEPACARPSPGACPPCQGTPASGTRWTVPVPQTWTSLTFRAAGAALLGLVQLVSRGQGFVSPSRIPQGLEQNWQTKWDLWKGLDGSQSLCLELWTQLVGRWAGASGLPREALQHLPGGVSWQKCIACGAELGADWNGELGGLGN